MASQCAENLVCDNLAYSRWAEVKAPAAAAHSVPLEDDRVLILHHAEPAEFYTPLTITCGAKQVQKHSEPSTIDHLMLAAEQLRRPTLTLANYWVEQSISYKKVELPRPKKWYVPGESDTLTTYSPVLIFATMDGVDVNFNACLVVDVFHPGTCL